MRSLLDNGLAQCLAEGLKGPAYQPVKTSYLLLDWPSSLCYSLGVTARNIKVVLANQILRLS